MGFVKLVLGGFVVLGVIYICVSLYSRSNAGGTRTRRRA